MPAHVAILTRRLPPCVCGIGDHTVALAAAIAGKGARVTLVAGAGDDGEGRCIVADYWRSGNTRPLQRRLEGLGVDHVVLQYTPLMYAIGGRWQNFALAHWWEECARAWPTSLIVHETYFRAWWHPPSLIKGAAEKHVMKRLAACSANVYTASQPLFEAMSRWRSEARVVRLPIGSNVPYTPVRRSEMRASHGIEPGDTVLVLFGGGDGLRRYRRYVDAVDALLARKGVAARWLLLGGVKAAWFRLALPVTAPGFVTLAELSAWLQAADVLLMPHVSGLCAKRGTLMAALQHGLPVVGTCGPMTDAFWRDVVGVKLTPGGAASEFAQAVYRLTQSAAERLELGAANREHFAACCTWERIADTLLASWARDEH